MRLFWFLCLWNALLIFIFIQNYKFTHRYAYPFWHSDLLTPFFQKQPAFIFLRNCLHTVVVSEETGTVSTTKNGEIIRGISGDRLKAELYGMQAVAEKNKGRLFFFPLSISLILPLSCNTLSFREDTGTSGIVTVMYGSSMFIMVTQTSTATSSDNSFHCRFFRRKQSTPTI